MNDHTQSNSGTKKICGKKTRAGKPCQKSPIKGGTVCRLHGGSAPQVKRAAKLRLLELVDPAIATLARIMATSDNEALRLKAADSILDRGGLPKGAQVTVEDARSALYEALLAYRDNEDT
jgi:hypothetical protein